MYEPLSVVPSDETTPLIAVDVLVLAVSAEPVSIPVSGTDVLMPPLPETANPVTVPVGEATKLIHP